MLRLRWRMFECVFHCCYDLDSFDMLILVLTVGELCFVVELWQGDLQY